MLDKELLEIFEAECSERLTALGDGLLQLEDGPHDPSTIAALFREAHNLKGAANMVGLRAVAHVMHEFEELLGGARTGRIELPRTGVAHLSSVVDGVRGLVDEARSGVAESRSAESLIADVKSVMAIAEAGVDAPPGTITPEAEGSERPTSSRSGSSADLLREAKEESRTPEPDASSPAKAADFRLESLRVDPRRLDSLLTLAGELTVARGRAEARLQLVRVVLDRVEHIARERLRGTAGSWGPRADEMLVAAQEAVTLLADELSEDTTRLRQVVSDVTTTVYDLRLVPIAALFQFAPRLVRDLANQQGKLVRLTVQGAETAADKRVIEELRDPLLHLIRNAVDHGLEPPEVRAAAGKPPEGQLYLRAGQTAGRLYLEIEDDGLGLDRKAIRRAAIERGLIGVAELSDDAPEVDGLIFEAGLSTRTQATEISGRGVGMDVVRDRVAALKGSIRVQSSRGSGTRIRLELPISLTTARVLIVVANETTFGIPLEWVQECFVVRSSDRISVGGHVCVERSDVPVAVDRLARLLELASPELTGREASALCVVLRWNDRRLGVLVDQIVDEQEVVTKPLAPPLGQIDAVEGAAILRNGELCLILRPLHLFRMHTTSATSMPVRSEAILAATNRRVLLADDSLTTRARESAILSAAGYDVTQAMDGADALSKFIKGTFAAVVTDIEMPRMDGITLTERIRSTPGKSDVPVILVTTLNSDEDRLRGLRAGASAYLTKGEFDQRALLTALEQLI